MSNIVPRLVKDKETGKLCMQVSVGGFTATAELPDDIKGWPHDEQEAYFEKIVPEIIGRLQKMRRVDQRKLRRKSS